MLCENRHLLVISSYESHTASEIQHFPTVLYVKKNSMPKVTKYVVFKNSGKKYPDDLLLPPRFWSVHLIDILLPHYSLRDFINGSEVMQLTQVGHVTVTTTWRM